MADPFQKLPAASDNVQNHTQVTEVVELAPSPIRDRFFLMLVLKNSLTTKLENIKTVSEFGTVYRPERAIAI